AGKGRGRPGDRAAAQRCLGDPGPGGAAGAVRRDRRDQPRHLLRSRQAPGGSGDGRRRARPRLPRRRLPAGVAARGHTGDPAGPLELSAAIVETIHDPCCEVDRHLLEVRTVADELGLGFLGMGFQPKWRREDLPWMPKGRYRIMREYMPKDGSLGLDMMTRTCTVQVNLDVGDEADMVKKFRVSLALQPVATALFADSPFTDGKPNGFLSYRSHVWSDTDPDRTGMLDFVFEEGF